MTISHASRLVPLAVLALAVTGCASVPGEPDPRDPLQGMNRSVYRFNDAVDRAVFKPVAQTYRAALPDPVRSCVSNFFGNIGDVWSSANLFLQGRVPDGINGFGRVLMNTTVGGLGCFDAAATVGVPRQRTDFGVTLGSWGLGSGPYLVLPFFGPSTVRDGAGLIVDVQGNFISDLDNVRLRNTLWGVDVVDTRASLLDAGDAVDDLALDPYSFVRDAYLQRRQGQVNAARGDSSLPDYTLPDYEDTE
jgi:phospholipid-binding lipoprotein MlaA